MQKLAGLSFVHIVQEGSVILMKKILLYFTVLLLIAAVLAGCTGGQAEPSETPAAPADVQTAYRSALKAFMEGEGGKWLLDNNIIVGPSRIWADKNTVAVPLFICTSHDRNGTETGIGKEQMKTQREGLAAVFAEKMNVGGITVLPIERSFGYGNKETVVLEEFAQEPQDYSASVAGRISVVPIDDAEAGSDAYYESLAKQANDTLAAASDKIKEQGIDECRAVYADGQNTVCVLVSDLTPEKDAWLQQNVWYSPDALYIDMGHPVSYTD